MYLNDETLEVMAGKNQSSIIIIFLKLPFGSGEGSG